MDVAFRKLNEWRERESVITFGPVQELIDEQGETTQIHAGSSGTRILSADAASGTVSLLGEGDISLVGASFRFSDWEDSPFNEADLGPEEFESTLEATFPDGRIVVFAQEWPL
jgi:hypothetical protein